MDRQGNQRSNGNGMGGMEGKSKNLETLYVPPSFGRIYGFQT